MVVNIAVPSQPETGGPTRDILAVWLLCFKAMKGVLRYKGARLCLSRELVHHSAAQFNCASLDLGWIIKSRPSFRRNTLPHPFRRPRIFLCKPHELLSQRQIAGQRVPELLPLDTYLLVAGFKYPRGWYQAWYPAVQQILGRDPCEGVNPYPAKHLTRERVVYQHTI